MQDPNERFIEVKSESGCTVMCDLAAVERITLDPRQAISIRGTSIVLWAQSGSFGMGSVPGESLMKTYNRLVTKWKSAREHMFATGQRIV